jgi:hypothetical protein
LDEIKQDGGFAIILFFFSLTLTLSQRERGFSLT